MAASNAATLPKQETGISALLDAQPEADGRGTLVAVLDTGCDLAAAGLQETSDGRPKYVDFIDCTGGGDIDTSKKVKPAEDGTLEGLSGRTLKLGGWAEGVDEFRLGALRLYGLGSMPTSVLRRLKEERKAAFVMQHQAAVSAVQRELDGLADGAPKEAKRDLELRLEQYDAMMDGYTDHGPLLDVLLWRQQPSGVWQAVIDVDGEGDLSAAEPMAPYAHARQVGDMGHGSALTYCVQVYDEGERLSVVTDAGSHGTHVAGIVAANFALDSALNGVAPGAQVLACKIGDGRLGSAETGTGLVRALIAAKARGCDLINLSYGEPAWQHDSGRVAETFTAAVRKWGMCVFTSAGNDGPALSSLGSPGALSAPICVGAYVSPAMMAEQYSMLPVADVSGASYSFSSRGPTPDGFMPSLCAPGGAIAPVPRHALQGKAQYHGTSMSSPNACGVAACVLSALKQAGLSVGPIELRRALENSARPIESEPFAQGAGLINAPAALAYALEHHGKPAQDLPFALSVPSRGGARGIYLRDAAELQGPLTFGVLVQPLFEHAATRTAAEVEELLSLELQLQLGPTAPWVTTPASMVLLSAKERGGQTFTVRLDPSTLPPGAHFAAVQAVDATDPARGPLFSLPITVVIPHAISPPPPLGALTPAQLETARDETAAPPALSFPLTLQGGVPVRRFISVPESAEWAKVTLRSGRMANGPHAVLLHAVPSARGDLPNTACQTKRMLQLRELSEEVVQLPVRGGATLELCMQLSWLANPAPATLDAEVEFHSYGARGRAMHAPTTRIGGADAFARIEVGAPLRTERLAPEAELTAAERALRPSSSTITAGSAELDVLPPSDAELRAAADAPGEQIHSMLLQYSFDVAPEGDAKEQPVLARVQSLHEQLYDAPLDSMLWRLDDANGQTLQYGGAMHDAAETKLKKGSYSVSVLLRHPDRAQLTALKELPLLLRMPLPKPMDCVVHGGRGAASKGGHGGHEAVAEGWVRRGGHKDLYVCKPTTELPKWVSAGDVLTGHVALDKGSKEATKLPLAFEAPPAPVKKAEAADDDGDEEDAEVVGAALDEEAMACAKEARLVQEDVDELERSVFRARLQRLGALRKAASSAERYNALADAMLAESPPPLDKGKSLGLELLLEVLAFRRQAKPPAALAEADMAGWRAEQVQPAAEAVLDLIDADEVSTHFGRTHESEGASKAAKEHATMMDEQRSALRLALLARASALASLPVESESFSTAVAELKQWVDKPDALKEEEDKDALALTLMRHELARSRPGAALKVLRARLAVQEPGAKRAKEVGKECVKLYRDVLGLELWASNMEEALFAKFPVVKLPL
uniref:tripeptidyl-peptidase II n=1 Tax=Emiliania huxleyi TaxID=2903 RepID=A0A7S3WM75_EMIHU